MHQNDNFSKTETKSQSKKTIPKEAQTHTCKKKLLSQTENKSLNQKITATHYPFILFKIPFLELRPNLRIRKSLHQYHIFIFKIVHTAEEELYSCKAQQHTCRKKYQKATATNFLFLLFKISFLEMRPSLILRKSFNQCHFLTFQNH